MGLQTRDPNGVLAELEKTPGEMNEEQVRLAARYILQLAIAYYETEEGKKDRERIRRNKKRREKYAENKAKMGLLNKVGSNFLVLPILFNSFA
ncbi:MAG: hypothetical protein IJS52_04515 [Bacilli bacterium]|nr:hypothetical protein [Bacilli bacterium]